MIERNDSTCVTFAVNEAVTAQGVSGCRLKTGSIRTKSHLGRADGPLPSVLEHEIFQRIITVDHAFSDRLDQRRGLAQEVFSGCNFRLHSLTDDSWESL